MNDLPPESSAPITLEQLLLRDDMWVGHSNRFTARAAVATGYDELNSGLLNKGWPLASLVEVCQQGMQCEWQLFTPALLEMSGLVVLLNPPAAPFSQAFIQAGIDLDRLIIVSAAETAHFLACFIELTRASLGTVMAWQPKASMTYTELRKCQLAASEGSGLSVIFRPSVAQQQSSPAPLRLYSRIVSAGLEVTVFKQKGHLQMQQARPIVLGLPERWNSVLPYHVLNQKSADSHQANKPKRSASVIPLRGKS
jgi:protein ImuA